MRDRKLESLSKFLSLLLRHKPDILDLKMSKDGFVDLDELVRKIRGRKNFSWVTHDDVKLLVRSDEKGRFEIKNGRIRARYGHTYPVSIDFETVQYKRPLYHGTALENLNSILSDGIKPMKRNYVHLSVNIKDAIEVGRRKSSRVVVLEVNPECLYRRGYKLYRASDTVYLVSYVPPECIVRTYKY